VSPLHQHVCCQGWKGSPHNCNPRGWQSVDHGGLLCPLPSSSVHDCCSQLLDQQLSPAPHAPHRTSCYAASPATASRFTNGTTLPCFGDVGDDVVRGRAGLCSHHAQEQAAAAPAAGQHLLQSLTAQDSRPG
jgi:hypothetical protein